jgi:hypothetical protein
LRWTKGRFHHEKAVSIREPDILSLSKAVPLLQAELKSVDDRVQIEDDEGDEERGDEYVSPYMLLTSAFESLHG